MGANVSAVVLDKLTEVFSPGAIQARANVNAVGAERGAVQANANANVRSNVNAVGAQSGAFRANANADINANVNAVGAERGAVQARANARVDTNVSAVGAQSGAFRANAEARIDTNVQATGAETGAFQSHAVGIETQGVVTDINGAVHVNVNSSYVLSATCICGIVAVVFLQQLSSANEQGAALFRDIIRSFVVLSLTLVLSGAIAGLVYFYLKNPPKSIELTQEQLQDPPLVQPQELPPLLAQEQPQQAAPQQAAPQVLPQVQAPAPALPLPQPSALGDEWLIHVRQALELTGDARKYDNAHRVVSIEPGHRMWRNVNNKKLIYENAADKARAALVVERFPELRLVSAHHNAHFGNH